MPHRYKLVFFCPHHSTQTILQSLFRTFPTSVGRIGLYEGCALVTPGTGQFRPVQGANPAIGAVGEAEFVEEDRVEVLVLQKEGDEENDIRKVLAHLKQVHPSEEVAYDVYKLEDL